MVKQDMNEHRPSTERARVRETSIRWTQSGKNVEQPWLCNKGEWSEVKVRLRPAFASAD